MKKSHLIGVFSLLALGLPQSSHAAVCPVPGEMAYKTAKSSAVYYVDADCKKRPFKNAFIFETYFSSSKDIKVIPEETLMLVPPHELGFMPLGPKYDPKYGAVVKTVNDNKVYFLLNGKKYWITSESVFLSLGYKWNWVEDIDQRLLDKYIVGGEINDVSRHLDGTIIKYAGSADVFVLENGKKKHIPNEAEFNRLGYRWDRIVEVPANEIYANVEDAVQPVPPVDEERRIIIRGK